MSDNELALLGGNPVRSTPLPTWPHHAADEIQTVMQVLQSGKTNYWTGQECRCFEQEFADFIGARYAIAVMNGTAALELALHACGIGSGDDVVVTSRTFIASASCIVTRGATPLMADVHPHSQNITAESVRQVLTPRTRAIIAVHLAGWPCEMDALRELANQHDLWLIEDCAQAIGACYQGAQVGTLGDIAAFSFCQDKIMSTGGEGGMLVTNSTDLWTKAWAYKDHGKSYQKVHSPFAANRFRWLHDSFGTNLRMTEMQASIGRMQLRKLPQWLALRQRNAALLSALLKAVPGIVVHAPPEGVGHAYYKFYAFIDPDQLKAGWSRDRIIDAVVAEGIPCFSGSCGEIYLEQAFPVCWRPGQRLRMAQQLAETALMLQVHPTLNEQDMMDSATALAKVMRSAVGHRHMAGSWRFL